MKQNLQLKLHQQFKLTPQLQLAIRCLQLSSMELEQEIKQMLANNPLLECEETEDPIQIEGPDNEWYIPPQIPIQSSETANCFTFKSNTIPQTTEMTLHQHLLSQTDLVHFSELEHAIAWMIVDSISEDGYLTCTLEEIASSTGLEISAQDIEPVLNQIQQFDPAGVGARSLSECLALQLNTLPISTPWLTEAKKIVAYYLDLLGKKDYSKLKNLLKLPQLGLEAVIKILTSLDPKPGRKLSNKPVEYIVPDVIVKKKHKTYSVELNSALIPQLKINHYYETYIQKTMHNNNYMALKKQFNEANWFINSLKSRQQTLLSVASHIIQTQKYFLDFGEEHMKPLALQDVAHVVGLHESTISRITSHKYILTPRGIFELKYFFSNSLSTNFQAVSTSGTAVRALIKKWILSESPHYPFSDQQIVEKLNKEHIYITRRTVSKYREALRIPASHERKIRLLNQ